MNINTLNTQSNDASFPGIWEELQWRGLVKVNTDLIALKTLLNGESISFYCGFDPTAPSLHVGNLVQLLTMRRLQLAGHRPLALVGGSTGLIGDPRPTAERILNTPERVAGWVTRLQGQVTLFLSMEGVNGMKLVNNLDWFGQVSAIDFLRDLGKFFRVGPMLKKDAVRSRLESDAGISFTEFSYQILQASDFLELFRNENCVLQTGGSDQWGNLVGGVELVGRVEGESVHAFGTPLITNTDGTKFGKSEGNAIWLDGSMTSPFKFFQFWLNTSDADVIERLKTFTFLTRDEVEELEEEVRVNPGVRAAQKRLAFEMTALVHGRETAESIVRTSSILFGSDDFAEADEETLVAAVQELDGTVSAEPGVLLTELMVEVGIAGSLGEARRLMKQNGFSVNNRKVTEERQALTEEDFLFGRVVVLKKGRKLLRGAVRAS